MQDICANDRRADFAKAMRGGWLKTSSTRFDDRALAQVTHLPAAGRFRWGEAPARPRSRRALAVPCVGSEVCLGAGEGYLGEGSKSLSLTLSRTHANGRKIHPTKGMSPISRNKPLWSR